MAPEVVPVELPLYVTSPPTPRTQTPPPCESGLGLAGALINALLCVRKTEFDASIEEIIAPAAVAPPENIGPIGVVTVEETLLLKNVRLAPPPQACANASEEVDAMPATAVMPRK